MKEKEKIAYYCYIVASICFYISAIIEFFSDESTGMAVTHLCLGSAFLCLATTQINKKKDK